MKHSGERVLDVDLAFRRVVGRTVHPQASNTPLTCPSAPLDEQLHAIADRKSSFAIRLRCSSTWQ